MGVPYGRSLSGTEGMRSAQLHVMKIEGLQLKAKLGCTPEERSVRQEVRVDIEFRFAQPPQGALSDDLRDTICYAKVSEALREHVSTREYNLVEKLASDFRAVIGSMVEGRALVSVTVHKVRPPVEGLIGGVKYQIVDLE
jgi:dihydroneopterin aldolase